MRVATERLRAVREDGSTGGLVGRDIRRLSRESPTVA